MSKSLRLVALVGLTGLSAQLAVAQGLSHSMPYGRPGEPSPPSGLVRVAVGGEKLTVWPYSTSDFEEPSDPVNLIFPNADPREIRQELMKPKGPRTFPFNLPPFGGCQWTDAMGYEQAAYALPGRWVGGAIQLACVNEGAPLGDPFRLHVRLFRSGRHTLGAAHFEILIDKTPEHQVLSWDYARSFVTFDMTGALLASPVTIDLIAGGTFREVRRAVYDGIAASPGGPALLGLLGLVAPASPTADVPIPLGSIPLAAPTTLADAAVIATAIDFEPQRTHVVTTTEVTFDRLIPKPFCVGVPEGHIGAYLLGPLQFVLSVSTGPSGRYERTYSIGGTVDATVVPAGHNADASIFEVHHATIDDRHAQVTEQLQQSLLGDPFQSMAWSFAAGDTDRFIRNVVCGP